MVGTESDEVRGELPGSPGSECLGIGEGEGGHNVPPFPLRCSGLKQSRRTPGKQDSIEPARPGPVCSRQQSVVRLCDVADVKI